MRSRTGTSAGRRSPPTTRRSPPSDAIEALRARLRHYDPSQLAFQLVEIAGERTYLRHGIEVGAGAVVLDVGANVGVAAAFFATECGAGLVHSFEPVAPVFDLLRENVAGLPACVPHPYGLSSADGTAPITFYRGAAAMSGLYADPERDRSLVRAALANLGVHGADADAELAGRYEPQVLRCELRTLSGFLREEGLAHVDLLKIDVERAERDVLAGIADEHWPAIRQVVVEVHDEEGGAAVARALTERGFAVATEQDAAMRGTEVRMLYARRP
jgi:FkbM family methyltransferase